MIDDWSLYQKWVKEEDEENNYYRYHQWHLSTKWLGHYTLTTTSLSTAYHTQCQSASNHHCWADSSLQGQHSNQYTTEHCLPHSVSSQPLTTIAELTQICKANTLTNTPWAAANTYQKVPRNRKWMFYFIELLKRWPRYCIGL